MGTLRDCIRDAGKLLKPADGDALLQRAKEYFDDGLKLEVAWESAVKAAIDDSLQQIDSIYEQAGKKTAKAPVKKPSKKESAADASRRERAQAMVDDYQRRARLARDRLTQMEAQRMTAARPRVGSAPDGSDDLLSEIAQIAGVVRTQGLGGEYDDIVKVLNRGVARRLNGGKKGMAPDRLLQALNDDGGAYKFATISELADAISKAVDTRQRTRRDMEAAQAKNRQEADFQAVVLENKKRSGGAKSVAKDPNTLKVGETFKAAREKFEVVDIDEATGEVIVRDGPRFGTQRIPPDGAFYPDRGTLRRLKEEDVNFLDDEDVTDEAPAAPPVPAVTVPTPPVVRPRPTDEQVAASTNGVEGMTDDALQNVRRLQVFPRIALDVQQDVDPDAAPIEAPEQVAAGYTRETPFETIDRAVSRQLKGSSNWSVVVVDNGTGDAYMRSVYRGDKNELLVDYASRRVGNEGKQGSTVSAEADLLGGTLGRPLKRMLAERLADGSPRFTLWGLAELSRATGTRNLNMGKASGLDGHPVLTDAAKRFWQQEARRNPATLKKMPAAESSIDGFPQEMAGWRRENPGEEAGAKMAARIAEFAKLQAKAFGAKLTPQQIEAWTQDIIEIVEQIARVEFRQSVLMSVDYTVPTSYTADLYRSALRALVGDRSIDVVAFEQALVGAAQRTARTTGMVINPDGQRKILAFALQSLNGPANADTILSLLHEIGHHITDGLPEPLRVAFHEAIRTMPHQAARWLKNPRSMDARLLANANPASLSLEQRAALERLTAEEIAAARRMDPAALVEEQAAEHLAQLGWDRAEARGAVQKLIRFVKDLWLRMAFAVQRAMKGPDHISPTLARQYAENRFLQFIHRDSALASDRISDLLNWLGVRPTARELIPVLPAGRDTEQRTQHLDAATGRLIPIDHGVYTPDGQAAYLRQAIEHATAYAELFPDSADTEQARFTKRVMFSAPLSFTPARTTNTIFAALNLESEIYRQISTHSDIGRFLPPGGDFVADWLTLPPQQAPSARVADATAWADQQVDPTTQQPVRYDAQMTVDNLPATEEQIRDREGRTIKVQISESQDKALQFTVQALGDAQRRVVSKIKRETDRLAELKRQQKRNPADFPADSLEELTKLEESIPLRAKIAEQLIAHSNRLLAKFQPGDLVSVYAGAQYFRVPGPDATEQQIRDGRKGTVPRDLKFTDQNRSSLGADLAAMEAWLLNADNRNKGKIYGVVSETYRKLMLIPTFQQRAATAALMRQTITGSFADEFRKSGMPSVRLLGKKMAEVAAVVNRYDDPLVTAGATWSTAAAKFAESLGLPFDQGFYERIWDPMMRTWNFIDVAERNQIGTPGEANLFTTIEGAFKQFSGVALDSDAKRARMRDLLMATIEVERITREIFEANPSLKVHDKEMGVYRRLVSHGLATGRRQVSQHIEGLFVQMNPQWSSTRPVLPGDIRSFWDSIPDAYSTDRAAFDAAVAELFPGYVVRDFVEPVIGNNVQVFSVVDQDGTPRKASLLRVRQAWNKAEGDVIKFAEALHQLEGGDPASQSLTVSSVLNSFRGLFAEIKAERDARLGAESNKHEVLPRQMMDARRAQDWPAEWVSYAGYDQMSNLMLLHQLGLSAAFGPDPLAADGELNGTITNAKEELAGLHYRYDEMARAGRTPREIEAAMGREDYAIARNARKIQHNLDSVVAAFSAMSSVTNYLTGDLKAMNDALGFAATMMVQSPRAGLINLSDLLGAVRGLKLSRPGLKALGTALNSFTAEVGNTLVQAFGQNAAWNITAARRRVKINGRDSAGHIAWREKLNNIGPRGVMAKPTGPETLGSKAQRVISRTFLRARDIIPNIGSPLQGTTEAQTLAPKARWGIFPNSVLSTMGANVDAAVEVFADLAAKGIEYINQIPAQDRAQFVRHLELGIQDLSAEQLGYFGGLILNDAAAFDSLRGALADKVPGESTVGRFVAKAFRRHEAAAGGEFEIISDSQFAGIANYANSEWTLQSNFSSLPYWMQAGPMRPLFIFLTWPYLAMRAFGKTFQDADGRMTWWGANSTVKDGLMAFFVLTAPLTIAASFAIDWYDKYLLGKRQNLREANWLTAVPVVGAIADPHAFVERVGRYGGAGFATDLINQLVNYDTERNLSLDTRIVAVNAISSLLQAAVATPIRQEGNITYASVVRPFLQSIGAGGMLQYLQIGNNLLGLNTQDAAINSRINTGNYIRAAGRVLELPVRVFTGPQSVPTPVTPYLQQMELAALVNNTDLFRSAYRQAVDAARDQDRTTEQARKYVADNFAERHPLRRLFKGSITETDYRKILSEIDPYGSAQVRASINSYNRYLKNWFGKPAYYGKASQQGNSVESLIRQADRINSGAASMESLLAIP